MKRTLKIRKGEPIHKWINRIGNTLNMTDEQIETMQEVAIQSYIKGSNDADELNKKHRR